MKNKASLLHKLLIAAPGMLLAATLTAQTPAPTPAPAPVTPSAPAAPEAQSDETPRPPRPPRAPRPPRERASTAVLVGNGFGSGMGFGSGSFLGVDIVDVGSDRVSALRLPDESGVEITAVDQDSPAGKAQLKEHDVIRTFNGQKVDSAEQMRRLIRETPPGRTVELGLIRDGKTVNVKVQLADRQTLVKTITIPDINIAPPAINFGDGFPFEVMRGTRSGMQLESLTPQLRDFFGVPAAQGLLVRSVERGSNAEAAGIKAGDVIVKINNQPVRTTADFQLSMRGSGAATVPVTIVRDKKEQTLNLKLPEKHTGTLMYAYPDDTLVDLEEAVTLAATADQMRAWAQQQRDLAKQLKDSQKQWKKQLEEQMKELQKNKQSRDED